MRVPEIWRDVPGYAGQYAVSDRGRVRSLDRVLRDGRRWRGRVLRPAPNDSGHLTVCLGRGRTRQVHALVLLAFVGPPPPGMEGCHGPAGVADNCLTNLRYDTRSENIRDKGRHGEASLTADVVRRIRAVANAPRGAKQALARELGIAPSTISDVLKGRVYAYL